MDSDTIVVVGVAAAEGLPTYTWILSSLGFGATVMQGAFSGHILRVAWPDGKKTLALLALGFGSLAAGWLWSFQFPIIKHIWTSSMVLWSGGWCYLLLAAFFWVIDVQEFRKWAFPLVVVGTNAIAVYGATSSISARWPMCSWAI